MRLGLIGKSTDPHVTGLKHELERRGITAVIVDTTGFPKKHLFTIGRSGCLYDSNSLADVPVFFLRSVLSPLPNVIVSEGVMRLYDDWHLQYMRAREKHGFLLSWLLGLAMRGAALINAPQWGVIGQLKPHHTDVLIRAGVPIPPTVMTSDPDVARSFLAEHPDAVYKPVMGGAACRPVDASVHSRLDVIRDSPVILQKRLDGECIRVTMTSDHILSAVRIPKTTIDFRETPGYDSGQTAYEAVELPPEVEGLCFRALSASGYSFSGIDLIRCFPSEYYFLECNYAPAFAEIASRTGHPIYEGIVDLMLATAADPKPDSRGLPDWTLFDYRMG